MKTKYTVYQTTNLVNGKTYIGVHQTTESNDQYLGSGSALLKALQKYGRSNFKKDILFEFDTLDDAYVKEAELVNDDFVKSNLTYNLVVGGHGGWHRRESNLGKLIAKDSIGNRILVRKDDPRLLSGELLPWNKGTVRTIKANEKISNSLKGIVRPKKTCQNCGKDISVNAMVSHMRSKNCSGLALTLEGPF